ncbi:MAG: response regulator, partial [Kiritimatiellaceae bacterium]|nr:response regulator [Kiritimatiellaceae bacterium]
MSPNPLTHDFLRTQSPRYSMEKNDPIKLLAIDDTPDNLIALSAVVRDALPGTIVLKAENGLTGIELAVAEDPDVILLDIVMPGMDGFETCRRLKLNEKIRDVPVVFLTALKTDSNSRVKALEVGGEGFLAKPLEPNELIAQIQAMTKVKAANRSRITEKARLEILVTERTIALQQNKDLLHSSIEALTHRFAIINAETYDIEMANSAFGGDAVIGG